MRMTLELFATGDRIEGRLHRRDRNDPVVFSGVLELLAAIEDLHLEPHPAPDDPHTTTKTKENLR